MAPRQKVGNQRADGSQAEGSRSRPDWVHRVSQSPSRARLNLRISAATWAAFPASYTNPGIHRRRLQTPNDPWLSPKTHEAKAHPTSVDSIMRVKLNREVPHGQSCACSNNKLPAYYRYRLRGHATKRVAPPKRVAENKQDNRSLSPRDTASQCVPRCGTNTIPLYLRLDGISRSPAKRNLETTNGVTNGIASYAVPAAVIATGLWTPECRRRPMLNDSSGISVHFDIWDVFQRRFILDVLVTSIIVLRRKPRGYRDDNGNASK
ncbi:hypothetical protein LSAT2_009985 [Lamellibrachia satsuma]|nr:hypothetical protein LSAT2_009985 [Lamellibrachia satsuma]